MAAEEGLGRLIHHGKGRQEGHEAGSHPPCPPAAGCHREARKARQSPVGQKMERFVAGGGGSGRQRRPGMVGVIDEKQRIPDRQPGQWPGGPPGQGGEGLWRICSSLNTAHSLGSCGWRRTASGARIRPTAQSDTGRSV